MTTQGENIDPPSYLTQGLNHQRAQVIGMMPTQYLMGQYDAGGVRRHWVSKTPDEAERPTAGVSLPYAGSPVMLARIS